MRESYDRYMYRKYKERLHKRLNGFVTREEYLELKQRIFQLEQRLQKRR